MKVGIEEIIIEFLRAIEDIPFAEREWNKLVLLAAGRTDKMSTRFVEIAFGIIEDRSPKLIEMK